MAGGWSGAEDSLSTKTVRPGRATRFSGREPRGGCGSEAFDGQVTPATFRAGRPHILSAVDLEADGAFASEDFEDPFFVVIG